MLWPRNFLGESLRVTAPACSLSAPRRAMARTSFGAICRLPAKKSNCKVICFDLSETSKDPGEAVYVRVASELIAPRAQQRRQLPYWVGKLLFRRMPGDIELRYGLAHTRSSQLELIS